jgi:hypothetical protein
LFGCLAGDGGDEFEVLVLVQDREAGKFGGGGYEDVRYRGDTVLLAIGEQGQDLHGAVLDDQCQVSSNARHR